MMRASLAPALLLAACASGRAAPVTPTAPAAAAGPPVPLVGELARLQFYVGDWACTGHDAQSGAWKAEVQVRPDAEGHLLSVHMIGPADNLTAEIKGRNDQSGMWFHLWAARDGASGSLSAQHWEGDTLTSVDDADAKHRSVFTKRSDTRYTHRDERDTGAGWEMQWEKTCEKKIP